MGAPLPPELRKTALFYLPDGVTPFAEHSVASVLSFFAAAYRRSAARLVETLRCSSSSQSSATFWPAAEMACDLANPLRQDRVLYVQNVPFAVFAASGAVPLLAVDRPPLGVEQGRAQVEHVARSLADERQRGRQAGLQTL